MLVREEVSITTLLRISEANYIMCRKALINIYLFIFMLIIIILIVFNSSDKSADIDYSFPDGFLIGTASSSYQVEGAWNESGKLSMT